MFDINAWEAVIILAVAFVVIGPERLPEYAAKLGRLVRRVKVLAEDARGQLREQMGPEFDDIDWRAYDPRQYDPRRIVRQALSDPVDPTVAGAQQGHPAAVPSGPGAVPQVAVPDAAGVSGATGMPWRTPPRFDPDRPTPFDEDAT